MTAKRYHKLFRSEMTKLMAHKPGAAECIKRRQPPIHSERTAQAFLSPIRKCGQHFAPYSPIPETYRRLSEGRPPATEVTKAERRA